MSVTVDAQKTGVFDPSSVAITGGTIGGASASKIGAIGSLTPPFVQSAISQQSKALNAARVAYEDSSSGAFDERWPDLSGWELAGTPGMQVSGGALYSTGAGGGASGANRSFALASTDNLRAVFTVNYVGGGTSGGLLVGVSKDTAGATPTASAGAAFGLFFRVNSTTAQSADNGVFADVPADSSGGAQPALATGQYMVVVTVDQTYISVVATRVANGEEIRARRLRSGFSVNNLYIFNSDTRGLTGANVGPVGGRKAVASVLPLATYETVKERAHWSGDGTNNFKLHIPTVYDSRKPLPLVICFHGNGATENHWAMNANGKLAKDAFVAAGYAVLGCTYAANNGTWGAQTSLDAYLAAYNWARSLYPIGPVAFYGNSMGGIESLLVLAERRIPGVVAWVGTSPTTNLADNYANSMFTATIDAAYSISGGNYASKTAGHDPMLLDASLFRGVPMLFLAATDDATVSKAANADLFAAKVASHNACTVTDGITGGHSFSLSAYTATITAFLASAFAL